MLTARVLCVFMIKRLVATVASMIQHSTVKFECMALVLARLRKEDLKFSSSVGVATACYDHNLMCAKLPLWHWFVWSTTGGHR